MTLQALAASLALAAAAPAGAASSSAQVRPPPAPQAKADLKAPDLSTYPPEQRARWPLVVQKCSRCHNMDVSLNHAYSPAEWKASMRRMVRLPGAAISAQQAAEILEFIRWYSARAPRRER